MAPNKFVIFLIFGFHAAITVFREKLKEGVSDRHPSDDFDPLKITSQTQILFQKIL